MNKSPSSLRLEDLEAREVPAAQVAVVGHTLIVTGDDKADTVAIQDNGQGTLTVDAGGKQTVARDIHHVAILTGGGDDKVTYTLTGALKSARHVVALLGTGADTGTFDFKAGVADGGRLSLNLNGGIGADKLKVDVGGVAKGGSAEFVVRGGPGKDGVYFHSAGDVGGRLVGTVHGDGGDDALDVMTKAKAVGSGKVWVRSR